MEKLTCVCEARAVLGEGSLWDPDRGVVWWVDIRSATIHAHDVATGRNHRQSVGHRVTAIALCEQGDLVACGDAGFVRMTVGPDLTVHLAEVLARPDEPAGNRFNDGKVDPAGRFWAGTMDDSEREASGSLYRLDGRTVVRMRSGIQVPNGPCFLADGTMLLADTAAGVIHAIDLDGAGHPREERVFARFASSQGYPDGMTLDDEGCVWIAFWDGGCVRRLSPEGDVLREVRVPVRRPTCPVFGGPGLQWLYVSTASEEAQTPARPHAWSGGMLRLDVGARGRPPHRFRTLQPQSA